MLAPAGVVTGLIGNHAVYTMLDSESSLTQRIRDKIAASKKKGMWMGGLPPLGYDVRDRKLVANQEEAKTLQHIFRRYVELRAVRALKAELDAAGIRSKQRTFANGTVYGGHKLSRGVADVGLQQRMGTGARGSARRGSNRCTDPCVARQDLKADVFEGARFGGRPLFIEEPSSSRHGL